MPQTITHGYKTLLCETRARVASLSASDAIEKASLQRMGIKPMFNFDGGFTTWRKVGGNTETRTAKS